MADEPLNPDVPLTPLPVSEAQPQSAAAPSATPSAAGDSEPKGRIDAPSVFDVIENEPCPNCKAPLATSAVVCMKCGYDMVAGKVRSTRKGVEIVPEKPTLNDFVTPGRGTPRVLMIIGCVLMVLAMAAAAYFVPAGTGFWRTAGAAALAGYQTIFHTGTGALAVAATALALHYRFARIDLVLARVFVAFAAFQLIRFCDVPPGDVHAAVVHMVDIVRWLLALGAYWAIVLLLFRRTPLEAALVGGVHMLLLFLTQFAAWLEASQIMAAK